MDGGEGVNGEAFILWENGNPGKALELTYLQGDECSSPVLRYFQWLGKVKGRRIAGVCRQ